MKLVYCFLIIGLSNSVPLPNNANPNAPGQNKKIDNSTPSGSLSPVSTVSSEAQAEGSASGSGATFGSLAYTTGTGSDGTTFAAAGVTGSTKDPNAPISPDSSSSGVVYNINGNGGYNYGTVTPGSEYSTSSSFSSQSDDGSATGKGSSMGKTLGNGGTMSKSKVHIMVKDETGTHILNVKDMTVNGKEHTSVGGNAK